MLRCIEFRTHVPVRDAEAIRLFDEPLQTQHQVDHPAGFVPVPWGYNPIVWGESRESHFATQQELDKHLRVSESNTSPEKP
jgi:hypothetical protein